MKSKIVYVDNVARLQQAAQALLDRSVGMPGMGLVWGPSGYGKSTAVGWLVSRVTGVYVRACASWSPASMMTSILRELGIEPKARCYHMVEQIVEGMAQHQRPLFIDEADYLFEKNSLVDHLRDIHDLSLLPVVLVGMEQAKTRLNRKPQLAGRMAEEVVFKPASESDVGLMAGELLEVDVEPAVLDWLLKDSAGEMRHVVVGFNRLEKWASRNGLTRVEYDALPNDFAFFTGKRYAPKKPKLEEVAAKPAKKPALQSVEGGKA